LRAYKPRVRNRRKEVDKFGPNPLFSILVICPKTVLNVLTAGSKANADQVVEIAIGQAFDVQVNGRAVDCQVRKIGSMDFVLSDCERSQGMTKVFWLMSRASAVSARVKRIGQLWEPVPEISTGR
jgi:hypothetical protein